MLDFETSNAYNVQIRLYDDGVPSRSSNAVVEVSVTDQNDAPTIVDVSTSHSVREDAAIGSTVVTSIVGNDEDGDLLAYSLSGESAMFFSIDSNSPVVRVAQNLNHENASVANVAVRVTDGLVSPTSI